VDAVAAEAAVAAVDEEMTEAATAALPSDSEDESYDDSDEDSDDDSGEDSVAAVAAVDGTPTVTYVFQPSPGESGSSCRERNS
jgi:hypothetical protein